MKTIFKTIVPMLCIALPGTVHSQSTKEGTVVREKWQVVNIVHDEKDENGVRSSRTSILMLGDSLQDGGGDMIIMNGDSKVTCTGSDGRIVVRSTGSKGAEEVFSYDLSGLIEHFSAIGNEQMENLSEDEINAIIQRYIPGMPGVVAKVRQLPETFRMDFEDLLNAEDGTDTIINRTEVTGDGKMISKVIVTRSKVTIEEPDADMKKHIRPARETLAVTRLDFFPNPSDGKFRISFESPEKGDLQIRVSDSSGKAVHTERVKNFEGAYSRDLDLTGVPRGIYMLEFSIGGKNVHKKLVIG